MPLLTQTELTEGLLAAAADAAAPDVPPGPQASWRTLAERRSVREFEDRDVEPAMLARILGIPAVEVAVATSTGMVLWEGGASGPRIADAVTVGALREQYAAAPVLVFFHGAHTDAGDYHRGLIRAGMAGYEVWLAAIAEGLAGCPFGRSSGHVVKALRQSGRPSARHLFTVALGWAA